MTDAVEGLEDVLANLNREIDGIKGRTVAGLLAAGLLVEGESNRRVPVEYGNLRGSSYARRAQDDPRAVEVGYTANYAVFVHENLEQKLAGEPRPSGLGTYWNPGGPKFLERALNENRDSILAIIQRRASVEERDR